MKWKDKYQWRSTEENIVITVKKSVCEKEIDFESLNKININPNRPYAYSDINKYLYDKECHVDLYYMPTMDDELKYLCHFGRLPASVDHLRWYFCESLRIMELMCGICDTSHIPINKIQLMQRVNVPNSDDKHPNGLFEEIIEKSFLHSNFYGERAQYVTEHLQDDFNLNKSKASQIADILINKSSDDDDVNYVNIDIGTQLNELTSPIKLTWKIVEYDTLKTYGDDVITYDVCLIPPNIGGRMNNINHANITVKADRTLINNKTNFVNFILNLFRDESQSSTVNYF